MERESDEISDGEREGEILERENGASVAELSAMGGKISPEASEGRSSPGRGGSSAYQHP